MKENISEFLAQQAQEGHTQGEGVKDNYKAASNDEAMADVKEVVEASNFDSAKEFIANVEHAGVLTQEADLQQRAHPESRWKRVGRRAFEVLFPVAVGVGARQGIEALSGLAGGPLVSAGVGALTGAASSYYEASRVQSSGLGAKELYQKVNKPVGKEGENGEVKSEGRFRRFFRNYSTFAKRLGLERGFKVKERGASIEEFMRVHEISDAEGNVDKNKFFNELITKESVNTDMVRWLTKEMLVQSVLSGFSEKGTTKGMRDYSDLLLLSSAALYERIMKESREGGEQLTQEQALAQMQEVWKASKSEIADRVASGKRWYVGAGAMDRMVKSAAYTAVFSALIDTATHLKTVFGENQAITDQIADVQSKMADHQNQLGGLNQAIGKSSGEVQNNIDSIKHAQDQLQEAMTRHFIEENVPVSHVVEHAGGVVNNLNPGSFDAEVTKLFGENAMQYMQEGGSGVGGRIYREVVIKNIWTLLQDDYSLRKVVQEYARTSFHGNEFDAWNALVMRAQYAGGGDKATLLRLIHELGAHNLEDLGSMNQGLEAAGRIKPEWHDLIKWAVESPQAAQAQGVSAETVWELRKVRHAIPLDVAHIQDLQSKIDALLKSGDSNMAELKNLVAQRDTLNKIIGAEGAWVDNLMANLEEGRRVAAVTAAKVAGEALGFGAAVAAEVAYEASSKPIYYGEKPETEVIPKAIAIPDREGLVPAGYYDRPLEADVADPLEVIGMDAEDFAQKVVGSETDREDLAKEVQVRYRAAARIAHPDLNGQGEEFIRVNNLNEFLGRLIDAARNGSISSVQAARAKIDAFAREPYSTSNGRA